MALISSETWKTINGVRHGAPALGMAGYNVLHGSNVYNCGTVICIDVMCERLDALAQSVRQRTFGSRFARNFGSLPTLLGKKPKAIKSEISGEKALVGKLLLEAIMRVEYTLSETMYRLDEIDFALLTESEYAGHFRCIWSTTAARQSYECAEVAMLGFNELIGAGNALPAHKKDDKSFADAIRELQTEALPRRLTSSVAIVRDAAIKRGIACSYVGHSCLRIGQGLYQQEARASSTNKTSFAAAIFSMNKRLTNQRLRDLRLPVPRQVLVESPEEAGAAAKRLGYPVVVKPDKEHGGRGVTSNIRNASQLLNAYEEAARIRRNVLVEEYVEGRSYRLLVLGGTFKAATLVDPPSIEGDGVSTIRKLIDTLNADPQRDGLRMVQLEKDKDLKTLLQRKRLTLSSVPAAGQMIELRSIANVSKGGVPVDVTESVHPDNIALAERAATGIGLDVAGVDLIASDVGRSYRETGGKIVEVNARPGLCMHTWPKSGTPRDVGGAIVELMFPAGSKHCLNTVVIVGDQNTAIVARDLDDILRANGSSVGVVIRRNAFVNGEDANFLDEQRRKAVRLLCREPTIDTLVWTIRPRKIVECGLQLNAVDVAVIAGPQDDMDVGQLKAAIEIVVQSCRGKIIFAADNLIATEQTAVCSADRILLLSRGGITSRIRAHLSAGGSALVLEFNAYGRFICYYEGQSQSPRLRIAASSDTELLHSLPVSTRPLTGKRSQTVEDRMFAIAASAAMGLPNLRWSEAISVRETTAQ